MFFFSYSFCVRNHSAVGAAVDATNAGAGHAARAAERRSLRLWFVVCLFPSELMIPFFLSSSLPLFADVAASKTTGGSIGHSLGSQF